MARLTTARSPRAFLLAVLLHALLVGTVLLFAWWHQRNRPETPQIFELVAGPGNDYAAITAPAPDPVTPTVKLELPEPPAPKIERVPEPTPPPKREPVPPPPAPKVKKAAPKIEKAPEPKPAQPRTTFNQFVKEHGPPKTQAPKAPPKISPKTIDVDALARRAPAASDAKRGAGGTALSRPEMDLWEAYRSMIIQRIRRSMESAGMTDLRSARVEFRVSAMGDISGARIVASSGSAEFDAAVLAAFRSIGRLGPPPTGQAETLVVTIEMRERG